MAQRIIKFRGKSIISDEWLYGNFYDDGGEQYMLPTNLLDIDDYEKFQVDPDTVGEYTGLTDKMGNGVYEGDILRVKEYKNLCWDLSKSREERDEMMRTFALDDLKGELDKEYISAVAVEEGTYCLSSNGDYNDMYLSCLFGPMNGSLPIFDFEIIGNIHDNPEIQLQCSDRFKKK